MPSPTLEVSGSAIVLLGAFNPAIFQPQWFAKQGLLPQTEVDKANIGIIHPQVCQFDTERFALQITDDRFTAATKPSAVDAPLRDLVAGAFYILEHTPIQAMGLNKQMHYAMHTEEAWHRIGDKLVPKAPWNGVFEGRPGMRNLQILYAGPEAGKPSITVVVQPSVLVTHGVYFEVNSHFANSDAESTQALMSILNEKWEEAQTNAERIAGHILDWSAAES
jgi:hypothetical protein